MPRSISVGMPSGKHAYVLDQTGTRVVLSRYRGASAREYLEAAESYIHDHGWHKGDWSAKDTSDEKYDADNAKGSGATAMAADKVAVCVLGSIIAGVGTLEHDGVQFPLLTNVYEATDGLFNSIPKDKLELAVSYTKSKYGSASYDRMFRNDSHKLKETIIAGYNDMPGTTEVDIRELFDQAKSKSSTIQYDPTATGQLFIQKSTDLTKLLPRIKDATSLAFEE